MTAYQVIGPRTVRDDEGREHDFLDAVSKLHWVDQRCPSMPHQYVHKFNSPHGPADPVAYAVVEKMLGAKNPDTYTAYFRGGGSPNRYWEAPDGQRYWMTFFMINRCWPHSVEPPRRVDQGAKPIAWEGCPLAPYGSPLYERYKKGWLPTEDAIAAGYQPCVSCQIKANVRRRSAVST